MSTPLFPERLETDRLVFERVSHDHTDIFELYDLAQAETWQSQVTEHMPWFRFETLDQVAQFVDDAERQWKERTFARYTIRPKADEDDAGELAGLTSFRPQWKLRSGSSSVILAERFWGRGYGTERAEKMVELTFERFDLDCYYTTAAAGNDRSQRMISRYIESFGGTHEGLLRQFKTRPTGEVTDQHRYTITREEYESATKEGSAAREESATR
ncbi:acetyltransferase [Haloprofundus marisrubri]|uniref:Acetyltransferase n=1 Tax=Haloprofundus marisrubri TaxID=1514971 RepID=A0A0W1R3N0_9EURY|nr:GNAT family protein [Haloprofundus marisrubri]KTG07989.1 acetyltransferase [Haloprofundus marisrubri]